jgi:ABC-2 type transport system ATP-binding protein
MLKVQDVVKRFDEHVVVNRVSFEVGVGEIFALLGPNGAGKTTLIRMITDILKPDEGHITLDGHSVTSEKRPSIAYLPEERGLYRKVRTLDALSYYGELKGLRPAEAKREARALLERVGLGDWIQKPVQALSKGMAQKAQLCTALIGSPRLMILDEPFSGLDPLNVQLLEDLLHERRAQGATILLSTHQMNKVEELCDRALMINRGHMVLYGPVREIRRKYSDHAVTVHGGRVPEGVPGVDRIEAREGQTVVRLQPGVEPAAMLRTLLDRGVDIESYALTLMPLEDIFVKVVTEGLGLDHGRSGPPVPDESLATGGAR